MDTSCPHCLEFQTLSTPGTAIALTCASCGGTFSGGQDETEVATLLPGFDASALATLLPKEDDTTPAPTETAVIHSPAIKSDGPKQLGHFQLIEKLGEGACGAVYKAHDTKLDRTVAIKIPRGALYSAEDSDQFLREARAAAQLRHPNVVSVHEVSQVGRQVYIVSDFIEGKPLDAQLTARPFLQREAVKLFVKIVEALEHAHQHGIVHRDLKPANVLLDKNLEPYVADFGLAKRESDVQTMTSQGGILGTPAYMAPEQAQGNAHTADRRADVYSLGVILYELLTGKRPFHAANVQTLLVKIVSEPAPSPRILDKRVPKDLETICLRCLKKDPSLRFQTAGELAEELHRFLRNEPINSRPVTPVERLWRWCHRNPTAATLFAAVVATGLLGGVVSGTFSFLSEQRLKAEAAKQEQEMNRREAALAMERAAAAKLRVQQTPKGWTSAQIQPEAFNHLQEDEAVNTALDQYLTDRSKKRGSGKGQYDVKALTNAVLGVKAGGTSGQANALNQLEGDLDFLNETLAK